MLYKEKGLDFKKTELQNRLLKDTKDLLGNQAMLEYVHLEKESGKLSDPVVQLERKKITVPKKETYTAVDFSDLYAMVEEQIHELRENEANYLNWDNIDRWIEQFLKHKEELDRNVPPDTAVTIEEIRKKEGQNHYFFNVMVTVSNLIGALNNAMNEYDEYMKDIEAEKTYQKPTAAVPEEKKSAKNPYEQMDGQYVVDFGGAIAYVKDSYVVVVEHYQLKHNCDLGILMKGGPCKGAKGSQLKGGWDAHRTRYAPAICSYVNEHLDDFLKKAANKVRLDEIEAYITVEEEDGIYIVSYHGNPPN